MKHRILYIVLTASCLLAGCEQYEAPSPEAPASGRSLQLGAVEVLTQEAGMATRATAGYTALTTAGTQLSLFRKASAGDSPYPALDNVPYAYQLPAGETTNYAWLPTGGDDKTVWLHPTADAEIAVCYAPHTALTLVSGQLGVASLQAAIGDGDAAQGLWYGHLTANGSNCRHDLSLKQAYCRMQITILTDESVSYVENPYLYKLAISGGRADNTSTTDGIFSAATLDLFKDAPAAYNRTTKDYTAVNLTANTYRIAGTAADTQSKFDLLMIPAALTDGVTLTVSVGVTSTAAKAMTVSIPAGDFGGALQAGKIYKVSVKIKGTNLGEISGVTTDWAPWTSGDINFATPDYNI